MEAEKPNATLQRSSCYFCGRRGPLSLICNITLASLRLWGKGEGIIELAAIKKEAIHCHSVGVLSWPCRPERCVSYGEGHRDPEQVLKPLLLLMEQGTSPDVP